MMKVVVQENKEYSYGELRKKINTDEENFKKIVSKLKKKDILEEEKDVFKFQFVGLSIINNRIIFVNPKYASDAMEVQLILKLLMEYSNREVLDTKEEEYLSYDYENDCNILSIIDYLLIDYFQNGLYIKQEKKRSINDQGRIDWNRTIEKNNVMFNQNGQPIYLELVTWESTFSNNFIITTIHKYVINQCFIKLKELELLNVFNYDYVQFEISEDFDKDFMLNRLQEELNNQFEDRKISILKAMIKFINKMGSNAEDESIVLFGTKYFHVVWEKVNSYMFSNEYNSLSKYILSPKWKNLKGNWFICNKNKIKPDILKLHKQKVIILDAKYYNINLNDEFVENNPNSYDVIKQYTYQLAFENIKNIKYSNKFKTIVDEKELEDLNSTKKIVNAFLFPREVNEMYKVFGFVKLEIFQLEPILNIYVSTRIIFERYINNNKFSEDELDKFLIECEKSLRNIK